MSVGIDDIAISTGLKENARKNVAAVALLREADVEISNPGKVAQIVDIQQTSDL